MLFTHPSNPGLLVGPRPTSESSLEIGYPLSPVVDHHSPYIGKKMGEWNGGVHHF